MRVRRRPVREKRCVLVGGGCARSDACLLAAGEREAMRACWRRVREDRRMPADRTAVYTDGACLGNPGPGGWGWAVPGGEWACGAEPHTTNQRMELRAALEALREIPGPVEVVSDSTYVVNCFRYRWYDGWLRRGWKQHQPQAGGQPRPVGAAYRGVPGAAGRDLLPVGQGPLRRRVERDRRPARLGRRRRPAGPSRPLVPRRLVGVERSARVRRPACATRVSCRTGPCGCLVDAGISLDSGLVTRVAFESCAPVTATSSVTRCLVGCVNSDGTELQRRRRGPVRGRR